MADELSSARTVDLLRAIACLTGEEAREVSAEQRLIPRLEHLLDCQARLTLPDETVRLLPHHDSDPEGPTTVLVIQGALDGVVHAELELRREPDRPFGHRERVLVDLLRPHVTHWLSQPAATGTSPEGPAITQRQLEILALVRCGMSNKEIARALAISQATVRKHLENAFERLGAVSRTAAVAAAFGDREGEASHV